MPSGERVADRLGELGLLADQAELFVQPRLKLSQDRSAPFLAHGKTCVCRLAADVVLDEIEVCDAPERLAGDRRRTGCGELVEAPAHVCPAKGERCAALIGEDPIATIAVDLQDSGKTCEMSDRSLRFSVRRIDIGDARRIAALPGPVIARISPELPGLGLASAGIEHRRRGLVGKELRRGFQLLQQPLVNGPQVPGRAADPVSERGAIQVDALPGVDLRLAIERQVIRVFGDQHLGDRRLGRQPALDQAGRRRCLDDDILAGATGVFGPAHDNHAQLRRHDVEPLTDVFTDPMKSVAAARAGMVRNVDDHLDARQVRRQRTPVRPPLRGALLARGRIGTFGLFLTGRLDLLGLLEAKEQLILRQALRPAAEAVTLQFLDDLGQASILDVPRQDHRLQHIRIVGKLVRRYRHDRIRPYSPAPGDGGIAADSLGRGSARLHRSARPAGFMDPPPIQPFKQRRQLSGRQPHHAILHFRPAERAILQPLRIKADAGAVPEDQLDPIRPFCPEDIDCAAERIGAHRLAHQRGQPLRPLAEVDRLRRHHDLDGARRPDHDVAFSARITAATVLASAPRPTRMAIPSISSSITPASRAVFRFRGRAGRVGAGSEGDTTAGTKVGNSCCTEAACLRASRRQANTCCGRRP